MKKFILFLFKVINIPWYSLFNYYLSLVYLSSVYLSLLLVYLSLFVSNFFLNELVSYHIIIIFLEETKLTSKQTRRSF